MSVVYDAAPPPPSPLEGVTYTQEVVALDDGTSLIQRVFIIEFSKITAATLLADDSSCFTGADLHAPLRHIPLGNLVNWVYQQQQDHWDDDGSNAEGRTPLCEALLYELRRDGLNDEAMLDAVDAENGHISAHLPDDHPWGPGAPVVLRLFDDQFESFREWWVEEDELRSQRAVDEECADMLSTLGAAVKRLRQVRLKRLGNQSKLKDIISRLKTGTAVLDMVGTFALPPPERPKSWRHYEPEDWDKQFVDPFPDWAWQERYRVFQTEWHRDLLGACGAALNPEALQAEHESAANRFVDELRAEGAPYLEMLENFDDLLPGSKAVLRNTLHDGFELSLLCKSARARLVNAELAGLGQIAASFADGDELPDLMSTVAGRRLIKAIEDFDPADMEPEEKTPLGKWMLDTFLTAKEFQSHGSNMVDVLGLATPFIMRASAKYPAGSGMAGLAWAWHTLFGVCVRRESKKGVVGLLGRALDWEFERAEDVDDRLRALVKKSPYTARQLAHTLARTIHVFYSLEELDDAASDQKQLKALESLESVLKFAQNVFDLALERDSKKFFAVVGGKKVLNYAVVAGVLADGAAVAIAYTKYREVQTKRRTSAAREAADLDLKMSCLTFAVSIAGAIIGAEFVIIGLVIAGTAAFLADLDRWLPSVAFWTDMQTKPGPHAYLEGLLKELYDSDEFHATVKALNSTESKVVANQVRSAWRRLDPAPTADEQLVWNLGAHADSNLTYPARVIARRYWDISDATAKKVVRASEKIT